MTRETIRTFLTDALVIGPHSGAHRVALRAGFTVFATLSFLLATDHIQWSTFAAFGAFASLYGRDEPHANRLNMQISAGLVLSACVALGTLVGRAPAHHWLLVLGGALLAGVISVVSEAFRWHPPGPLFPVFGFTVCASLPAESTSLPAAAGVSLATAAFAVLVGFVGIVRLPSQPKLAPPRRPDLLAAWRAPGMQRMLLRTVLALVIAGTIGTLAGSSHPYWAMISTVAALSGPTMRAKATRGFHRLVGSVLGVAVAAPILASYPRGVWAVVIIALLQVGAELFVGRNYGIAVLFITPLALMMGQIAAERPAGGLLIDRAAESVLGCLVAIVFLWAMPDKPRPRVRHVLV